MISKISATQMSCTDDYENNILKAIQLIKKAKEDDSNVVLLQELFERKYFCQVEDYDRFSFAEEYENSKTLETFERVAKEYNVVLPISFFEKKGNCFFNSLCVIDNHGRRLGLYRKTHIPTGQCYEEKFYFSPGDTGFKVFSTEFGKIGIGICWDQWFLETGRILALKGADFIFFPTAIGTEPVLKTDTSAHWRNAMIGQSALNIIPVCCSNRIGREDDISSSMTFYGQSFLTSEEGNVLKSCSSDKEEVITCSFDVEKIREKRMTWGIFRDRRTEMYSDILKRDASEEIK